MADPRLDPYGINPFAGEESATPATEETPFADQLPFRFTQFAINPATQATTGGQTGRTAVARSPFTSGALAQELSGLRSQIAGYGDMREPIDPGLQEPTMPTMPTPEQVAQMAPAQNAPVDTGGFSYGLPVKSYELPKNLALVGGQSPIAVAQEFEKVRGSLTPDQLASLGEMTTVQGYDLEQMLGADKYNELMNAKGVGDGEQMFYRNLGVLPATFDPMLYKTGNLQQLASRPFYQDMNRIALPGEGGTPQLVDFNEYYNKVMAPPQSLGRSEGEETFAEAAPDPLGIRGSGLQRLGDTGLYFDPTGSSSYTAGSGGLESSLQNTQRMLYNNPEASGFSKFAQVAIPTLSFGAMAAMTGGAAGTLAGGGGGLAGALGVPAGMATTGVNALAGLISSVGLSQAAQQAGLPTDHPLVRTAMAIAGGVAGGVVAGAPAGGIPTTGAIPSEGNPQTIFNYLEQNNLSTGDLIDVMGEEEFIKSFGDPAKFTNAYDNFLGVGGGGVGSIPNNNFNLPQQGLKSGMGLVEAGVASGMPTNAMSPGLSVEQQMQYQNELDTYNQGMESYQQQMDLYNQNLDEWNKYKALQEAYSGKMSEYMGQREKYTNLLGLRSRQAGITSDIAGLIASNPYYQPELDLTGIQSRIV